MEFENSLGFAKNMDAKDPLRDQRQKFYFPQINGKDAIYLTGNSLGLQPKSTKSYIEQELNDWARFGVEGHVQAGNPWMSYHHMFQAPVAEIVGAKPEEVVVMNTLSVNLHLLLVSFFRPKAKRTKILVESQLFSSDHYIVESQLQFHGLDPKEHLIEAAPREGEHYVRHEELIQLIKKHSDELALILLGGVNYYSGQLFNFKEITAEGHRAGAMVGFDLAHAAGNVVMDLHDWEVDFAAWCSYKYLNSGPGGPGGVFIHEKHANNPEVFRFAGWWGHDEESRFRMEKGFQPMKGAAGWQLSNAQVLSMAAHKASVDLFAEIGMEPLRNKSELLTGFLEFLIKEAISNGLDATIITPSDPLQRGCQLSLLTGDNGKTMFDRLKPAGVIADWRHPNVIRVAPVPLYNTFEDVYHFVNILAQK